MKTILIAEDDPETRFLIAKALEPLGHTLVTADDGETALAQAEQHRPDLVLLDVLMPRGDGYAVCRTLRGRPAFDGTKIVFLSARVYAADRRQGAGLGADAFVTKPFSVAHLRQTVTELLDEGGD
jgi:two-component system alkaline phosphatase synthesis response regulator PhoP